MPYDLATALELWTAYRDHGILPRTGGYLDQPRSWRAVIRFISSRHSPIYRQHMREQDEQRSNTKHSGKYEGDLPVADGWKSLNWIED